MVGFLTNPSGSNSASVQLGIVSTGGKATITLQYLSPAGISAYDSFQFALTDDTTVVAWVDGSRAIPDPSPLPPDDPVVSNLGWGYSCGLTLLDWWNTGQSEAGGVGNNGLSSAEVLYANQFLIHYSANPDPQSQGNSVNSQAFVAAQKYRLYQRFQAYYEVANGQITSAPIYLQNAPPVAGITPEPCSGMQIQIISKAAQRNFDDGARTMTANRQLVYQVNEARLGSAGQAVNQFLNGPPPPGQDYTTMTPWIWSVIQFDANGVTQPWAQGNNSSNLQIFPAYTIFKAGSFSTQVTQGSMTTFIGLNSSSQYVIPK